MAKKLMYMLNVLLCGVLMVQFSGCGTLLYPERRGQKAGHVDVGVALLDGIGLLFFLVPGVIAFAIDFSNGTIYLPSSALSSLDVKNIKQVKFDRKNATFASIEKVVKEQTGYLVKLDQSDMEIINVKSTDEMKLQFAKGLSEKQDTRLSLLSVR